LYRFSFFLRSNVKRLILSLQLETARWRSWHMSSGVHIADGFAEPLVVMVRHEEGDGPHQLSGAVVVLEAHHILLLLRAARMDEMRSQRCPVPEAQESALISCVRWTSPGIVDTSKASIEPTGGIPNTCSGTLMWETRSAHPRLARSHYIPLISLKKMLARAPPGIVGWHRATRRMETPHLRRYLD
jgi:hypothetical protein